METARQSAHRNRAAAGRARCLPPGHRRGREERRQAGSQGNDGVRQAHREADRIQPVALNPPAMSLYTELRTKVIGAPLDPLSAETRRNIALVAFFAWVGLGADGISSSCYGPEESFRAVAGGRYAVC